MDKASIKTKATIHATRQQSSISLVWKLNREVALLLGWGRAILLQLAHPLVAAGVSEHSTFLGAGERARRLRRTIKAMLDLTFGEADAAARAACTINGIHDRVHGRLAQAAGVFPGGTPYSAHDPDLLRWVHATLVDSFLVTYELFIGRLSDDEKDRYCLESAAIEPLLGIPEGYLPRSKAALHIYMSGMYESGQITVTETARRLSREVLYPPFPFIVQPLMAFFRFSTAGMLPVKIREGYRLTWDQGKEKRLRLAGKIVRRALVFTPRRVRYWNSYRKAIQRGRHDQYCSNRT